MSAPALVVGFIVVLVLVIGVISSFDKTSGGEVAVVRNGGMFDNNRIRQVIHPASGLTYTGAQVTQAQAKVQQAKADALANREREHGYRDCPACAQIDTLKAIPPNVTTFAPGGNFAITK